jgi:1-acyl-sn-glycerol-3-phosphate acyltransferase
MIPERKMTTTGRWRATLVLAGFTALTLPLMPVQAVLLRASGRGARAFPHWYHRQVCRLLGIRLQVDGAVAAGKPVLLVANHTSWLDIPVLSAVAPVSFIAKKEVGGWPFVSSLARLQRSVFVDRTRRTAVGETTSEMSARLAAGDTLVLFAEGTSSDGNRVLPLRTSLFGAVLPGEKGGEVPPEAVVQTCAIVYARLHGLPLGRAGRPFIGWYGDMEMGGHAWNLLKSGPLDVQIALGPPVAIGSFSDRKALARHVEIELRRSVVRLLRNRTADEPLELSQQTGAAAMHPRPKAKPSAKWT